ncbi:COLD REGULATED PROTEIN 27 [Salix koriyanagi]|uniref:COLD REGULATED PROTEIN 27 n=2 Tax=Salix TaxID=40685 RepID=A0A9Q0PIB0_9ROSI|nr:COLD REGULATED PROTEIN 27 [Salix koriyanagi]
MKPLAKPQKSLENCNCSKRKSHPQILFPASYPNKLILPGGMETNMSSNSNKTEHNWTNEEHLHFLKSMEASFVRTMLENNTPLLRLDRYLPDSSESTLDLKSQRKKKHGTPDIVGPSRTRMEGRVDKRSTRRFPSSHKHYDPSQDQVVPQADIRTNDKDE